MHTVWAIASVKQLTQIISGLCMGRSLKEIIKFHDLKRTIVWNIKHYYNAFIAAGVTQGQHRGLSARPCQPGSREVNEITGQGTHHQ
jgi:hypothetical protein